MATDRAILDPDLIAKIGRLSVRARTVVDGVLTGLHKSPQYGSSIEFAEHREYTPGEDVRHIDWKAYARFDRHYIKKFEDETNLKGLILVDGSASMNYGEETTNKLDYARVLAAAVGYLLIRQRDAAGLTTFKNGIERYIPPRATSRHYHELLDALVSLSPGGETDLVGTLSQTAERAGSRGLVVVISDFFDVREEVLKLLARIRMHRNDVVLFQVLHSDEIEFPFDFLAQFEDLETDLTLLADPEAIRNEYLRVFGEFMENLRITSLQHGMRRFVVRTDRPPEEPLLAFLTGQEAAG